MSLQARLVLLVTALTTALLGGLGLYVGGSLRTWTLEVVDGELQHRADRLRHELRFERGRLAGELEDDDLDTRGLPFRVETTEGEVLVSQGSGWSREAPAALGFATVEGSGGRPLRVLSVALGAGRHRREHREDDDETEEEDRGAAGLVLRVAAPLGAFSGVADRFRTGLLVALALAVVLGAAGATLVARLFLRPLKRLSGAVDGIGASSLDTRLPTAGLGPELSRLAQAFNGVLGRLAEAFAVQRSFVGRASHALRTPLASILSQAEVTLRRERSPEQYREALTTIAEAARDSAHLADGLLALTRADAAPPAEPRAEVPLEAVAAELERLFAARAEAAGLGFTVRVPEGATVCATRGRLRELLDALVDNALRYTPRGGSVQVEARADGDGMVLEVRDDGPGLAPGEREQVFERFFRGSAASASGQPGSGLGLSVVRALATAEGAEVGLLDAPGGGTVARVRWPSARCPSAGGPTGG